MAAISDGQWSLPVCACCQSGVCVHSTLNAMGNWSLSDYQTEEISLPGRSKKADNLLL